MKIKQIIFLLTAYTILFAVTVANVTADGNQKKLVLPITKNTTGKTLIQTVSGSTTYPYNSYIITSAKGESVVVDPTSMPTKKIVNIKPAAIISTHGHNDHTDVKFTSSYKCKKIMYEKADIKTRDFHIYTILSSHKGDTLDTSNVIVVFEVDGLRIAHMGDIGQTALTAEQLKAIGPIDIAFMQFDNGYSDMSLQNEKGFKLIDQLKPTIIIPTHYQKNALPVFESKYGKITEIENVFIASKKYMPAKRESVYRILNTHKYW